jgi:DNA-binding response OmpR family regulator
MADASKKILVIEDDREAANLFAEELTDRGYEVSIAYNGLEGYSAILETSPDLVLSDLMMPLMSGFDVLERLTTAAPCVRETPFVFLTGLCGGDIQLKARQLGAGHLVTKPIDFDVLDTIISARLAGVTRAVAAESLVWTLPGEAVID